MLEFHCNFIFQWHQQSDGKVLNRGQQQRQQHRMTANNNDANKHTVVEIERDERRGER